MKQELKDFFGSELTIIKHSSRVTLTVNKNVPFYSIWIDRFVAALPSKAASQVEFDKWVDRVSSGEYDESEIGKQRAQLARLESAAVGERLNGERSESTPDQICTSMAEFEQACAIAILLGGL